MKTVFDQTVDYLNGYPEYQEPQPQPLTKRQRHKLFRDQTAIMAKAINWKEDEDDGPRRYGSDPTASVDGQSATA